MDPSNEAPPAVASASEQVRPRALAELLLEKDAKVKTYINDLERGNASLPTQEDKYTSLEAVRSDPLLLERVAEIARYASESEHSRISKLLLEWSVEALRAGASDLQDWMRLSGNDPYVELRQLAARLKLAEEKTGRAVAQATLAIGMAFVLRQFALEPLDALRAVTSGLATEGSNERARLSSVLRRASGRQLGELGLAVRLLDATVDEARKKMLDAEAAKQELYDRTTALKNDLLASQSRADSLIAQIAGLQGEIDRLTADIAGVRGDADHGEIELKARYRTMLIRRLRPYLTDAVEALEADPPFTDVASQRLKLGLAEIAKEQAWLDLS